MRLQALFFMLLLLFSLPTLAETYDVGPGQTLENVGDVPFESLMPGDLVQIHYRAEPYREKFVLCRQGEDGNPITILGVPGPEGQRPVLSGENATTRSALNYWNEARGLIKIGGANTPEDTMPAHIVIEGLSLRSARPPYTFTGRDGQSDYSNNAASVYIEKGEHIVLRDLEIHDSGNGLFAGSQTTDLLVEGCYLHGNGIEDSYYQHNNYTEALDIVFQFNRFGPLRADCGGNNLKDRSAGLVVRYNWIEGGNRQLDLVDAEGSAELVNHPHYARTHVYGNVLVEFEGEGNSQIIHYGGDSGTIADYRKGVLLLYNNTIVSTRSGNTTLLRLSTDDETADVRNNVIYTTAAGSSLAIVDESGHAILDHNWLMQNYSDSHSGSAVNVTDAGGNILGTDPAFVDFAGQDFHLTGDSQAVNAATALHADAFVVDMEYVKHQQHTARLDDGALDMGAYEQGGTVAPDGGIPDAGEEDAGSGEDAGTQEDAGTEHDAGMEDDAGIPSGDEDDASVDGGCGCDSSGGMPAFWGLLLPCLLFRRRG